MEFPEGRFLVTLADTHKAAFESLLQDHACACIGRVTADPRLLIRSQAKDLTSLAVTEMRDAWKTPFGQLL